MKNMRIGVDLAKAVFQVHGALRTGEVQFRKKLTRKQFPAFMAQQEPSMVIFEACGSAHFWAREMEALGHDCQVRELRKKNKNAVFNPSISALLVFLSASTVTA